MSMADALPASTDSVSTASTESVASSASSSSDVSTSTDSRAIAAELLGDTEAAEPAPQAADPSAPPPTPVAATSDGDDDATYQALLASGSMPVDRHKAVLTNARNKTRAEVEQEYRTKFGWAESFDRQRAEHGLGILSGLEKAPEQTLRNLATLLGVNLAQQSVAPTEPEGPPPPDVQLADGSEFYSAKQLAKLNEWKDAQYEKKLQAFQEQVMPLLAERQHGRLREQAKAEAGSILGSYRARYKSFTRLEPQIKQLMMADESLSLSEAALLAKEADEAAQSADLQARHDTDRASQLSRKAAASSAPPSAPRAVTPLRDRDRSTADITREVAAAAGL